MSNDMRIVKFETLIEDVNRVLNSIDNEVLNSIDDTVDPLGILKSARKIASTIPIISKPYDINTSLALIYDYNHLNDYGKIIMDKSELSITDWYEEYSDIDSLTDAKRKIEAAKELVRYCRSDKNRKDAYKFIFWAMMILSVDKTEKDEHLSLICDFARLLKITDDEMVDILQVIKVLYHEEESGFEFQSDIVPSYFSRVLSLYA